MREEQEDQMIKDSIFLDDENKQIVCKLPLRGKEHEFLSNNRDIVECDVTFASKILTPHRMH